MPDAIMDRRATRPSCNVLSLQRRRSELYIYEEIVNVRTFYLTSPDTILRVSEAVTIWRADPRLGRVASWKECRVIGRVILDFV